MRNFIFLIFIIYFVQLSWAEGDDTIFVDVPDIGKTKGKLITYGKVYYYRFTDIPYGRIKHKQWFQPAVPAEPVPESKVVNPDVETNCPGWFAASEDDFGTQYESCLVLKVDTKNVEGRQPVLVYIPGYDLGSGTTFTASGKHLLSKDVVFVTLQYRVGAFGFLSTASEEIPGNAGVLDIILALKWIKQHISHFGGDPNRVTLFGQYKAAGLIGVLTMSPLAEDLFQQVIYQSGSPLLKNLTTDNPVDIARKVATECDCKDVEEVSSINKCLTEAKFNDLITAYTTIVNKYEGDVNPITIGGPSGLISDFPENLLPTVNPYNILGGVVDHPSIFLKENGEEIEESQFSTMSLIETFKKQLTLIIGEIGIGKGSQDNETESKDVQIDNPIGKFSDIALQSVVELLLPLFLDLDGAEIKSSVQNVLYNNLQRGGTSYLYAFKYIGKSHYFPPKDGNRLRNYVTLADDFQYLLEGRVLEEEEIEISKLMVDLWTSFAATGQPSSDLLNLWPPMESKSGPYLIIDKVSRIGLNYDDEFTPLIDCQNKKGCEWIV